MSKLALGFQRQIDRLMGRESAPSIDAEKREKRLTRNGIIAFVRRQVFELDPKCICGECKSRPGDHMHEVVPRSALRGRPPEEIFNIKNCVRLSPKCHALVTGVIGLGKALKIVFLDPALGAMGPIELTWK